MCTDTLVKVLKTFTAVADRILLRKRPNALAQSFFCTDALRHDLDKAEAQNVSEHFHVLAKPQHATHLWILEAVYICTEQPQSLAPAICCFHLLP